LRAGLKNGSSTTVAGTRLRRASVVELPFFNPARKTATVDA